MSTHFTGPVCKNVDFAHGNIKCQSATWKKFHWLQFFHSNKKGIIFCLSVLELSPYHTHMNQSPTAKDPS